MNFRTICSLAAIALVLASSPAGAADATADAAWQKVRDAMNSINSPKIKPKSRDEAIEMFKTGLTAFDAAMKDFTAAAPNDPRRWEAKLFDGQTAQIREVAGLPGSSKDMQKSLDDILNSSDADAATKAEASGIKVMMSADDAEEGKGTVEDWTKLAEAHLKAFPEGKYNRAIKDKINAIHTMAELKTKPLDLKFTAVDGTEVDLAKLRGKVVLIDFWATWCGPCVGEVPNVVKAYEKLHPKGFEILGISLDGDKAKLENFTKEKGMTWVQFFDGKGWENEFARRFGIRGIPAMWLIDKKGMLVSTSVRGKLEEEVEKRLGE